jgi:hypothetical protein
MPSLRAVVIGVVVVPLALSACTSGDADGVAAPSSPLSSPPSSPVYAVTSGAAGEPRAATAPATTFTPIDPGPPPALTVPPRTPGEVARVTVTRSGSGKAIRNERGEPTAAGRTYTVEVACAAGRPSTGTSYAVYDAAPGTWGHGEPLYSRPFPCDGQVQRTGNLGLPAGAVQIDVRGLPADAVAAYAVIRPE